MARTLFLFALIIAAASAFVQPANMAGEYLCLTNEEIFVGERIGILLLLTKDAA